MTDGLLVFTVQPAAVSRTYMEHVYYQSANLREIPKGINGDGFQEYGANISRRWDLNVMHTPPCCTGNQARLLPNYIHHMWTMPADGGLAGKFASNPVLRVLRGDIF